MVPSEHRQHYERLRQALEQLRISAELRDGDHGRASSETQPQQVGSYTGSTAAMASGMTSGMASADALMGAVAAMTQQFQPQILALPWVEMDEAIALRLQSIQTEISKQLRLLAMDTMFLKTARQPETSQQRRQQIGDRLDLLLRYCEAILATETLATETLATEILATDLAVDGADLDQGGAELA